MGFGSPFVSLQPHHATHEDGGSDEVSVASLSGELGALQRGKLSVITTKAAFPAASEAGRLAWATDEGILYRDDGFAWVKISVRDHPDLDGIGVTDHHDHIATGIVGHGNLSGVSSDQHHAQVHSLPGTDHTGGISATQHGALAAIASAHAHTDLSGVTSDQHHAQLHQAAHQSGGGDALAGLLDAVAKTTVRKDSGADIGSRRRINLITGSNITLTIADDPTDEEVDITIAAAGGATLPTQRCKVYRSSAQSIPDSTYTIILWNAEEFDTDSMHSLVSNTERITINTAGTYLLWVIIAIPWVNAGYRDVRIYLNAAETLLTLRNVAPTANSSVQPILYSSTVQQLIAGDYIFVKYWQSSGAAQNTVTNVAIMQFGAIRIQ